MFGERKKRTLLGTAFYQVILETYIDRVKLSIDQNKMKLFLILR